MTAPAACTLLPDGAGQRTAVSRMGWDGCHVWPDGTRVVRGSGCTSRLGLCHLQCESRTSRALADRDGVESGLDHPSPHPRRVPKLSRKWRVFFPDDKFEQVRSALVGMRLSPL